MDSSYFLDIDGDAPLPWEHSLPASPTGEGREGMPVSSPRGDPRGGSLLPDHHADRMRNAASFNFQPVNTFCQA
jgi:hypothetical protein